MTILQLVTRRQRRGAEMFAADLSTALAGRSHSVHFGGLDPSGGAPLTPTDATCFDISDAPVRTLSARRISDLVKFLVQINPNVVQANGGYAMKYAVLAKRWSRGTWPILYCNIGMSSDWLRRPGQRLWNRWLLRQTAMTAAVSEASRADLLKTYRLDPACVEVVRRGVSTEAVEPQLARQALRRELGLAEDAAVLLHVGSFTPEKNHGGLLRIFARVRERHPGIHLVLVGEGPLRAEVEAQAEGQPDLHFLGVRSDVPMLMAGADLLILPSLTEGIPGVILEAGAQSLPSVAYDVGGVAEAICDGDTGRLIPVGDETAAAAAIIALLDDSSTRISLGINARSLIEHEFSLERSADAFDALYRRITAGCPTRSRSHH